MAQPGKTPIGLVLVLWFAGLCAAAQFAKISLIFPELRAIYAGHGTATGFLVTLLSLVGVVMGLFTGMIVARFGIRRPLLGALILGSLLSAFQATLPTFWLMLASRFVEGLSHLTIVVTAPTLIARISADRDRPMTLTLWGTFFGVAFAIVGAVAQPLIKSSGVPALFIAHAIAMFAAAIAIYAMLPRTKTNVDATRSFSFNDVLRRHVETYRSPFIAAPALGWLFYTLSFVSFMTILPRLLPEGERALANVILPLAGIASSMIFGVYLLRHLPAVQVIKMGFLLSGLCVMGLAIFPASVWMATALFASLGLVQGASFTAVPQLNPDPHAQAYGNGALAQMGNLGNLAGTVILLQMMDSFGRWGLIYFGIACYALGFATHSWLLARRSR
jgi:MFS transporter, DHA1 family, inner membrane transport protein